MERIQIASIQHIYYSNTHKRLLLDSSFNRNEKNRNMAGNKAITSFTSPYSCFSCYFIRKYGVEKIPGKNQKANYLVDKTGEENSGCIKQRSSSHL
jgi:hypothetical protein